VADKAITELSELLGAGLADTDLLPLVDVSDTSMAATGTDKKIKASELRAATIAPAGTAGKALAADDSTTTNPRVPTSHTHPESDVTGLVGDLDLRAPAIPNELGYKPAKVGKVLSKGAAAAWDECYVEGLKPFWDPVSQRWGAVFVGYNTTLTAGFPQAGALGKIGLAWSDDLIHWTKDAANPIFQGTGNIGTDWDGGTLTAPSMHVQDNGDGTYTYVLFYAGTSQAGWEASGGVPLKMGLATASFAHRDVHAARGNPIISGTSGWRGKNIFHRSIVKKGSTYYLFFNASTTADVESIGYATAPALTGPWTVQDANSPVLSGGAVVPGTRATRPTRRSSRPATAAGGWPTPARARRPRHRTATPGRRMPSSRSTGVATPPTRSCSPTASMTVTWRASPRSSTTAAGSTTSTPPRP
jgi:hypothetical protein